MIASDYNIDYMITTNYGEKKNSRGGIYNMN